MPDTFRALIAEGDSKQYSVDFKDIPHGSLPAGEVLIQAMYSSLNYKDGLAITRRGKVIRKFPMVLGVDLAGKVLESNTGEFKAGDEVLVTGQGLGETIWGGYSQLARLLADSLVHVPAGISAMQAMAVGTAGFTAMLGMMALEHNRTQAQREGGGGYRRRWWRRVDRRCFAGGKRLQSGSLNRAPGASLVAARSWSHHHC